MQDGSAPPPLKIVSRVTRQAGERFARRWLDVQIDETACEAFEKSAVIEWPESDPNRPLGELFDPRQGRYQDIEDEIMKLVFASIRPAVAVAFVKAAREVLARERRRQ